MIYSVIDKISQQEVTRYAAALLVELPEYPVADYDYVEFNPSNPVYPPSVFTWTPLEFMRRFTQEERIAIRTAASQSAVIEDYLKILDITTEVKSNDPDTINALNMLEQVGLIATGRSAEILSGQ